MLDIGWSELLVIGVVALLVVGPKELATLLRTVGKYVGLMRRQAAEFRSQFDDAMRESEIDKLKEEMEKSTSEATSAIREAGHAFDRDLDAARDEYNASLDTPSAYPPSTPSASTVKAVEPVKADLAEINEGASEVDASSPAQPAPAAEPAAAAETARPAPSPTVTGSATQPPAP